MRAYPAQSDGRNEGDAKGNGAANHFEKRQPIRSQNRPRDVSLIVCTYQRPRHLERCLESVACQTALDRVELIVSDDGSQDRTRDIVTQFAHRGLCPVRFATQQHEGFRVARVRNNGVALATYEYLVFADGDCVLPHHHVQSHLELRAPGVVVVGDSIRVDQETSEQVTVEEVSRGNLSRFTPPAEGWRMFKKTFKDRIFTWMRTPMRPRLTSNNFSMWRRDYLQINGFDEAYVGWGLEDVDLQRRLRLLGLRFDTCLHRTVPLHLWHPVHPTFSRNAEGTDNRRYFERGVREAACWRGFSRTALGDFEAVDMTVPAQSLPGAKRAA